MKKYIMIAAVLVATGVQVQAERFPFLAVAIIRQKLGPKMEAAELDCVVSKLQERLAFDEFKAQVRVANETRTLSPAMTQIAAACDILVDGLTIVRR